MDGDRDLDCENMDREGTDTEAEDGSEGARPRLKHLERTEMGGVFVCVCVCVCVFVCVCVCSPIYKKESSCTYHHIHTHVHAHSYTVAHTN